jgi:hypothetical protein
MGNGSMGNALGRIVIVNRLCLVDFMPSVGGYVGRLTPY